jgi:tetratricopeptide (TPR) repeat protein
MRSFIFVLLLGAGLSWAQNSSPTAPPKSQSPASPSEQRPASSTNPKLAPPHSDRVDASSLGDAPGESSSKDTQMNLDPPPGDDKDHPRSSDILMDEGSSAGGGDTTEFHPWDPHKAAKDIEVGDFYFKRKNYKAAEDRYREALVYKQNDALATFRLAVCLERLDRPDEARAEYENYLKILPYGPLAPDAKKAIEHLKSPAASAKRSE